MLVYESVVQITLSSYMYSTTFFPTVTANNPVAQMRNMGW